MLKKALIVFLVFGFIVANLLTTLSFAAAVPVTEEKLNKSLQKINTSGLNDKKLKFSVKNGVITVTSEDSSCEISYDLTDKPIFTYTANINQGMSYADYEKVIDNLLMPAVGYIAVADIQGVSIKDSTSYIAMDLLFYSLTNSNDSGYIIDEEKPGVEVKGENVIKASEFGEHVMEVVNSQYAKKTSHSDDNKTYKLTTERKDVTETSCKLVSTLEVNLDADFTKLSGKADKLIENFMNSEITEENADFLIRLKVGQKCNIISSEKIVGHEAAGSASLKFSEENDSITAESVGKANGYFYVGSENNKKSFYIIVEENTDNKNLEPTSITIGNNSGDKTKGSTDKAEAPKALIEEKKTPIKEESASKPAVEEPAKTPAAEEKPQTVEEPASAPVTTVAEQRDDTVAKTKLPKTGASKIVIIMLVVSVIGTIVLAMKNEKYKGL